MFWVVGLNGYAQAILIQRCCCLLMSFTSSATSERSWSWLKIIPTSYWFRLASPITSNATLKRIWLSSPFPQREAIKLRQMSVQTKQRTLAMMTGF